jgi:tetratricopeptide (TPR) repeat protein
VLAKLVDLMREEKDREGEAKYIEQILQVETEPQRRFAMFTRLGDLQRDMTGGEGAATEAYEKASQINPSSKAILIQLGQLYLKLARYDDAARVLFDAESLETEREKKASLAMSLGVMYAEYVKDPARAAPHLWRCLEYEPAKWDAFSTLERLAVDSGDWEQQRKLYRFALDRLGDRAGADLGYKLHFNLGKILLEKFGDSAAALEHLQEAARRKPDQMEPREILAGIYSQTADQLDLALAEYRLLLDRDPRNVNLLHMLRKTLSNMKRFDGAWCVTGILELLGAATPKEKAFYQKFASAALKIKPKPIELEMFKNGLVADSQEWELTEIVRVLFERLAPKLPLKSAKDVGLTRRLDAAEKSHQLAMRLIEIVSKVLGIPEPAAYFRELAAWVGKEACFPPALVVGPSALDGKRGKELRFELGKVLALFIPHHGAVGVLDRDTLRAMLGNVSKLIAPQMPDPPGDARAHAEMRATIQKLLPAAELVKVKDWLAALRARGGEVSVKRWLVGVEKTCGRVGLLMANDLQVAATVTRTAPDPLSSASREEMVDDLIRFTVSEPFELIRAHLGISVV